MQGIDVLIALLKNVRSDLSVKWKKTQAKSEKDEATLEAYKAGFFQFAPAFA